MTMIGDSMDNRYILDGNYKLMLEDKGYDTKHILSQAGLEEDLFEQRNPAVTGEEFYAIWETIGQNGKLVEGAIDLAAGFTPDMFNPVFLVCLSSENGQRAFERLAKYKILVSPTEFEIVRSSDSLEVKLVTPFDRNGLPATLSAFEAVFMVKILELGLRRKVTPIYVSTTAQGLSDRYTEYFGIEPESGNETVVRFALDDVDDTFLTKNEAVWDFYIRGLDKRLEDLKSDTSFAAQVRMNLAELLPHGTCSINDLATHMNFSKRTIQRRLTSEQTSFQEQLNHVREMLARQYLSNTEISVGEVAFLLGYSETNSFVRAFKLWTGQTIGEFRSA